MSVHPLDLARARRELREALGDDAKHVLAEIRLILADAELSPRVLHCAIDADPFPYRQLTAERTG